MGAALVESPLLRTALTEHLRALSLDSSHSAYTMRLHKKSQICEECEPWITALRELHMSVSHRVTTSRSRWFLPSKPLHNVEGAPDRVNFPIVVVTAASKDKQPCRREEVLTR